MKKISEIMMKMKNLMKSDHAGVVSFEFVIVLSCVATVMFTLISVPVFRYSEQTNGAVTGTSSVHVSFTQYIVQKTNEIRDYVVNNNTNVSIWPQ